MKHYTLLLVSFILAIGGCGSTAFALKICSPAASASMSSAFNYCLGNTASPIVFRYSSCATSDAGARVGTAIVIEWYKNTTNSVSGGTLVNSTTTTSDTTTTLGTASYTPPTSIVGTLYYYCVITWSGTGTCNTSGVLVSDVATMVTVKGPASAITGTAAICMDATSTLSNSVASGSWSSGDESVATISPEGVVTAIAVGTSMISYSTGCGTSATKVVTVVSTPVLDDIAGPLSGCVGITNTYTNTTSGGVWSSDNLAVATATAATGAIRGEAAGTATISYTFINSCASVTVTSVLTVNPLPVAGTITGASTVCLGDVATVYDAVPGGVWTSRTVSKATITAATSSGSVTEGSTGSISGVAVGTTVISYTVTNSCGIARATRNLTVNPLPVAGTIGGTLTVCPAGSRTLTKTITGGAWSSENEAVATVGTTGVVAGVSAGTSTITYAVTNSCGTAFTTQVMTVNPLPDAGAITGVNPMCIGTVDTLTDAIAGGTWKSSAISKATIDSFGVITGVSAGTTTISYSVTNSCGTARATLIITINAFPSVAYISGTATVCEGATRTLTNGTTGGTWSSSSTSIATVGTTGVVTGIDAGIATISYSVSNSCGTAYSVRTFTVNPLPDAGTVTGVYSVCGTGVTTLGSTVSGGTWTSSTTAKATVGLTSGIVTGQSAGTSAISYKVTNACGTSIATVVFTVVPIPAVGVITGNASVCVSAGTTLSDAPSYGVWSSGNPAVASICSDGVVTGIAAGTSIVTFSYANGCGTASITKVVTVNPIPDEISGSSSVCVGATTSLANSTSGGTWSSNNTAAVVCSSSGVATGVSGGIATISYVLGTGCNITKVLTVTASSAMKQAGNTVTSEAADLNISMFPNPNTGLFTISGTTGEVVTGEATIIITDMAGRSIYQSKMPVTDGRIEGQLNLNNYLSAGMYVFNIGTAAGSKAIRFTVR